MIFPYLIWSATRPVPNAVDEDVVKHDCAVLVNNWDGAIEHFYIGEVSTEMLDELSLDEKLLDVSGAL